MVSLIHLGEMNVKENKRKCSNCGAIFYCDSSKCLDLERLDRPTSCYCKKCYIKEFGKDYDWNRFRRFCYTNFNPSRRTRIDENG